MDTQKNSVLIVDDEVVNIIALAHMLSQDYIIFIEKSGQDCMETAKSLKPDVILLDVMMPKISGFEVIKLLKEDTDTQNIPVIFLTGLDNENDKAIGLSLGAANYIYKPFREDDIKFHIQNLMHP